MSAGDLAHYRAGTVAVVLQSDNLWSGLTARENVLVSLRLAGAPDAVRRTDGALARFGLDRRADHRPHALSGGEQQRVAIAAAAARGAPIVLADEPTGELDAANERIVLDSLALLRDVDGATVVTVTHSLQVADAADRVLVFVDGRVVDELAR
jgi:putative ABC transport system ATP-binding protein